MKKEVKSATKVKGDLALLYSVSIHTNNMLYITLQLHFITKPQYKAKTQGPANASQGSRNKDRIWAGSSKYGVTKPGTQPMSVA